MRFLLPLLLALGLALGEGLPAEPGKALTLVFPGLGEGPLSWQVELFRPLLLPERAEGLAVAVLEVPLEVPPGAYPVCLRQGEVERCQEVRVPEVRRLLAEVPAKAQGSLAVALENRGNVPLRVRLASARESAIFLPPQEVALAPGEKQVAFFSGLEPGELLLLLSDGREERRYLVRVEGEGGPPPYRLAGLLEGGFPGPWGAFSLQGALAREASLALRVEAESALSARVGLALGPYALEASTLPALALRYREGPFSLGLAYPWALEGEWRQGGEVVRLEASPVALKGAYARPGLSLQGAFAGSPSFRLEYLEGDALYRLAWEGGLVLGAGLPGLSLEAFLYPEWRLRALAYGRLEGLPYHGEVLLGAGSFGLSGGVALPLEGLTLGLRGGLGTALGLSLSLGGGAGDFGFQVGAGLSPAGASLEGRLAYGEGPWSLRLAGALGPTGSRLEVSGAYALSLPVPEEVSLALGGGEWLPAEGVVEVLGRPLPGARVTGGYRLAVSDGEGRFRLYLPRGGARVRVQPPPESLALPGEALALPGEPLRLSLPPGALLALACEGEGRGAHVLGGVGTFLPCGGQALLPPGRYRLLPEAAPGFLGEEAEVELPPLERVEAQVRFAPRPLEVPEAPLAPEVAVEPQVAAPGEVVRLRWQGGASPGLLEVYEGEALLLRKALRGEEALAFQVPWEAEGPLRLRLRGEGWQKEVLLPVDGKRPLLEVRLDPPRALPGQGVLVGVRARFPAEGAEVVLPGGRHLPLSRAEGLGEDGGVLFQGTLVLTPELLAEAAAVSERWWGLSLLVSAWQGDRRVQVQLRLLVSHP
ncbi:carboxypeptidase-like regulatory domain-containing protein [Thermus caliditerrae]|uniref:carboxypeptidase-like regulatory domain-containing protein n=1 Tax=Thermus caliditerrae TaxID=1330700 RepID=UPI001F18926F|nr:carboxypeptidase-like regulatory domain-containing protein [Thermus caliditerrae]